MSIEHDDVLLRALRQLAVVEPDAARTGRIHARCHAVVSKREKRAKHLKGRARFKGFMLEVALVGAFSLIYLCAMMYNLLRLPAVR